MFGQLVFVVKSCRLTSFGVFSLRFGRACDNIIIPSESGLGCLFVLIQNQIGFNQKSRLPFVTRNYIFNTINN